MTTAKLAWRPIALALVLLAGTACQPTITNRPDVLGIRFGDSIESIPKDRIENPDKPESYPLLGLMGYKLSYPNPENWEIIVQQDDEDLEEKGIHKITISKNTKESCYKGDINELSQRLQTKYRPGFKHLQEFSRQDSDSKRILASSAGRALDIKITCFFGTIFAEFLYLDLDAFKYKNSVEIQEAIRRVNTELSEFPARTL